MKLKRASPTAPNTITAIIFRFFTQWLKTINHDSILPHQLTADDVWQYRLYLSKKYRTNLGGQLSKKSQRLYLSALRALLKYFNEREIKALPHTKISLPKNSIQNSVAFLTTEDLLSIFQVPDTDIPNGLRDRAILELFFSTGMRIAELVSLNVDQFKTIAKAPATDTVELPIVGKGKRTRTIFISPRAAKWLHLYLKTRRDVFSPLFVNYRSANCDDRRLTARSIQRLVRRYADLAGVDKDVTPHTIRHSYATDLLSDGADLRAVQELLGHKNIATTQIYTHVTNKRLRDIHKRHHGIDNSEM